MLEAEFAVWAERSYRAGERGGVNFAEEGRQLRANAATNGSGYFVAMAALQTAWTLGRGEALESLDHGIELAERDDALAAAALLLVTRSTFLESTDPQRAGEDLARGLDMLPLTNAPFVDNMATDVQMSSRLSPLTPEAKLALADRLLVSWHRAGDDLRVFATLSTIITLIDGTGRPEDVVFLDEVIRIHKTGHADLRVRRRQTAAATKADASLGPAGTTAVRLKAKNATLEQIILRTRQALTAAGLNNVQ
jgi:hypothetical protein